MKLTKDTLTEAMSGISSQLITEAAPGSAEIKARGLRRALAVAASLVLVCMAVVIAAVALGRTDIIRNPAPGDTPDGDILSKQSSTAVIDGLDFPITYTVNGEGVITSASVGAPEGYKAAFSDTQGQFFEKMLLEITHGNEFFCVVCELSSGEVDDFMRKATYDKDEMDTVVEWHMLADYGASPFTWRYDKTGVTFIAIGRPVENQGFRLDGIRAIFAFDPRTGSVYRAALNAFYDDSITLFPKNGSLVGSNGDGGSFAVLWERSPLALVPEHDSSKPSAWYSYTFSEISSLFPIKLDSGYTLDKVGGLTDDTVRATFTMDGRACSYECSLESGKVTSPAGGDETTGNAETPPVPPEAERETLYDIDGDGIGEISVRWRTENDTVTDVTIQNDGFKYLGLANRRTVIARCLANGKVYLFDLETGRFYAGIEIIMERLGIDPNFCDIIASEDWSEGGENSGFIFVETHHDGTLAENLRYPNVFYLKNVISEYGPQVPADGEDAERFFENVVPIHPLIIDYLSEHEEYAAYKGVSYAVEALSKTEENEQNTSAFLVHLTLGGTMEDVMAAVDNNILLTLLCRPFEKEPLVEIDAETEPEETDAEPMGVSPGGASETDRKIR